MILETPPKKAKKIILDTDIGPDCDDAGALAVLHSLRSRKKAEILAVMHCTSSPWGAGCADAINTFYGCGNIPVGTLKETGFLDDDEQFLKYNRYIARHYPNSYLERQAEDAVLLYRRILAALDGADTTLIAIGPLRNIRNLLVSDPDEASEMSGINLIKSKVSRLVVMGGCFVPPRCGSGPTVGYIDAEWNIQMDVMSAITVADLWPTPIDFCGFEIGFEIITGDILKSTSVRNPVRKAYELHTPDMKRYSWDPATVLYGVMGSANYWDLSEYGRITIDKAGKTSWNRDKNFMHRYLIKKAHPHIIQNELNDHMVYEPASPKASL